MNSYQNKKFIKLIYEDKNYIKLRGNFLKKYSNRKYSLRSFILKAIPRLFDKKIIDIGCGDGSFLVKIHKEYPDNKYYGIDIVKNDYANKIKFLNYKVYNGEALPDFKGKFDVIICMHMLYHIPNFKKFFKWITSLLNDNGIIIITTKSKYTLPNLESIFCRVIKKLKLTGLKIKKSHDESHFCMENAPNILRKYLPLKSYVIKSYVLETQLIVNNKNDLIEYFLSTKRYSSIVENEDHDIMNKYIKLLEDKIDDDIFIDKYIEAIYIISKI